MNKFCIYKGVKVIKPETWDITSVELSSDYTRAIIQAESKSNKSEYTLDITPLISNQYVDGLDPYSSTIVNELTGVSDWVLDSANNQIKYYEQGSGLYAIHNGVKYTDLNAYCTARISYPDKFEHSYYKIYSDSDSKYVQCYIIDKRVSPWDYDVYNVTGGLTQGDREEKSIPLETIAAQVISNAEGGDSTAQQAIISAFNNVTDDILTSDYSEFFEQNKQPK